MLSRMSVFARSAARPNAFCVGRRQFCAQPKPKRSVLGIVLKTTAAVAVGSTLATCYVYNTNEGLRRSMQFSWFCTKIWMDYDGVEDPDKLRKLHEEWAPKSLDFILDLGGYYIKLAQTMVGTGYLPEEYDTAYEILLDRVPPRKFEVIQGVLEAELGCKIDDVFESFDREAIGAGSIGQVHRATLKGSGKEVVVKVQYPGVEDTFKMDFDTFLFIYQFFMDYGDELANIFDSLYETMQHEFNYEQEARFLRQAHDNIMPVFGTQVFVPLPIDAEHPDAPERSLCTRKVMAMEQVSGKPIKKYLQGMMAEWAESQGKSVDDFKAEMKEMYKDPEQVRKMLKESSAAVSETLTTAYIAGVKAWNWIFHTNYTVPLNGPRIIRTLCDVHAHQIFINGMFNSDPHAGNVLMMEDGRLGLIDYGACDTLTPEERNAFARLCVAISDQDDQATIQAMKDFGVATENNVDLYFLGFALLSYHRGFHPEDMKRIGIPEEIGLLEIDMYFNELDKLQKMDGALVTTQRCCAVLLGLAQEMGAGSVSVAKMFKPTAEKYLEMERKAAK